MTNAEVMAKIEKEMEGIIESQFLTSPGPTMAPWVTITLNATGQVQSWKHLTEVEHFQDTLLGYLKKHYDDSNILA